MSMVKGVPFRNEGCEAVWTEKGSLADFAQVVVWKLSKDIPARAEHGFLYSWVVRSPGGNASASGYAKSFRKAVTRAQSSRASILDSSVRAFVSPNYYHEKCPGM